METGTLEIKLAVVTGFDVRLKATWTTYVPVLTKQVTLEKAEEITNLFLDFNNFRFDDLQIFWHCEEQNIHHFSQSAGFYPKASEEEVEEFDETRWYQNA